MRLLRWMNLCYLLFMGIFHLTNGFEQDCPIDWSMYESVSKEKALIKCLLERYSNYTTVGRPVTNTSDLITVEFGLSLVQIMDVDEKNQVLETNVWYTYTKKSGFDRLSSSISSQRSKLKGNFRPNIAKEGMSDTVDALQWKDALLKWDPDKFDGLKKIMVPPDKVWIPDIVLYNFADSRLKEQRSALVNVFDDGSILWMPQAILRSTCAFDTKYFPFDENECHLKFGSWTHDGNQMDLQFFDNKSKFLVDDFIPGNEWDLVGNRGQRFVERYECCKDTPYLDLKFYILLRRKTAFYSFILLLPCTLLSCLTLVIFWVPPESPAKLMLGTSKKSKGNYIFVRVNLKLPEKTACMTSLHYRYAELLYSYSADSRLTEQRSALVNVFDDGTILWMPQAILRSSCAFNTTYFPFDETECHLKFGSWTHDGSKMDLQFFGKQEKFMVEDFIRGNEWELDGNYGRRNVEFYECCEGIPYLDLKFYIRLKRRTAFYSFILLLPCALLSCLTLTIFWVPPESPAKLQLDERLVEQRPALVNVEYTGDILWIPQAILRSSCAFETKFFPFDTQSCYLQFGSWTHDGRILDLQFFQNISRFMIEDYIKSNEWDIIDNRGERNVKLYECCKDVPYLDLKFHLTVKRRVAFYTFILIMPCALLTCLTLVIFWVPPEAPAKLSLGMNIFVAFFVLLLLLSESTPKAAESIPLIGAYFCLSMVMITMSTVLSTVIANMFFRGVRINRAPSWLRMLMIDGIATVLCLRSQLLEPDYQADMRNYKRSQYADAEARYAKVRLLDNGRQESRGGGVNTNYNEVEHNNVHSNQLGDLCLNTSFADDIRTIREILEQFKEKKAKAELKEKCLREWKVICCVTDRLFFISYLLINIVGIVVIFFGQPDSS